MGKLYLDSHLGSFRCLDKRGKTRTRQNFLNLQETGGQDKPYRSIAMWENCVQEDREEEDVVVADGLRWLPGGRRCSARRRGYRWCLLVNGPMGDTSKGGEEEFISLDLMFSKGRYGLDRTLI
jgi:hypothetical protein